MENIERIFMQEVKNKKKIGSNIFSRASTRKGGTNQALRTPYFYMSQRDRNKLNGKVEVVYNMKDIISYEEFKKKSPSEQKTLMEFWRKNYKVKDIRKGMGGIASNTFYKLINTLGLELNEKVRMSRENGRALTEEELNKYINSSELMDFNTFKLITSPEQRDKILESYLVEYKSINQLVNHWEGSYPSYLYHTRSRAKDLRERELNKDKISQDEIEFASDSSDKQEDVLQETIRKTPQIVDDTSNVVEDVPAPVVDDKHTSNIELKTNTFSFNLKGEFNAKTIKRRLELALEVLEDEEELLVLDISISNK